MPEGQKMKPIWRQPSIHVHAICYALMQATVSQFDRDSRSVYVSYRSRRWFKRELANVGNMLMDWTRFLSSSSVWFYFLFWIPNCRRIRMRDVLTASLFWFNTFSNSNLFINWIQCCFRSKWVAFLVAYHCHVWIVVAPMERKLHPSHHIVQRLPSRHGELTPSLPVIRSC